MTVVSAARVTRASIASKTVLTAEFQPFQEVDVMAKVAGYVRTIKVDLGDRVRAGQLLAELEIPEMTDDISKATAVVEQSRRGGWRRTRRVAESRVDLTILRISRTAGFWTSRNGSPGLFPSRK